MLNFYREMEYRLNNSNSTYHNAKRSFLLYSIANTYSFTVLKETFSKQIRLVKLISAPCTSFTQDISSFLAVLCP